jgi:hypothetical protein
VYVDEDGGSCGNVCIQKGRHVQVRVKEASYGYGLFLAPGVKVVRDDFLLGPCDRFFSTYLEIMFLPNPFFRILEYIGEIVDDNEADKRGFVQALSPLSFLLQPLCV